PVPICPRRQAARSKSESTLFRKRADLSRSGCAVRAAVRTERAAVVQRGAPGTGRISRLLVPRRAVSAVDRRSVHDRVSRRVGASGVRGVSPPRTFQLLARPDRVFLLAV